jgi:hypothetical protein
MMAGSFSFEKTKQIKKQSTLGAVAYVCNRSYLGGEV